MKALFLDCGMGAAGDMLTAALLDLLPREEQEAAVDELNNAGIPGVRYVLEETARCGIKGLSVQVLVDGREEGTGEHDPAHAHDHEQAHDDPHNHDARHDHTHNHPHDAHNDHHNIDHDHDHDAHNDHHNIDHDHDCHTHNYYDHDHPHSHDHDHPHSHDHDAHSHDHHHGHGHHSHVHHSMQDIREIVGSLRLPEQVKLQAIEVYEKIAAAEGEVHGMPVSEVHFHEVGMMDAVADVTAFAYLLNSLAPDRVIATPVAVGSGHVHCAHGILPVPAPATASLLRGIPSCAGPGKGELCTPTGAALLKQFVQEYGEQPVMTAERCGYGMGKREFGWANCVRALYGEMQESGSRETVYQLSCNLDDMTPEEIGFAQEELLAEGALDVWTVPVGMKKSRPGVLLEVLCEEEIRSHMCECLFRHTTTLGVREMKLNRYTLSRRIETADTEFGRVRRKVAEGYGVKRSKLEYEDLADAARRSDSSLLDIKNSLKL